MKIAQVAPLCERVVSYLTEELVRQGHHDPLCQWGCAHPGAARSALSPRAPAGRPVCGSARAPRDDDFLGQASAILFPIDWPKPFGLVMLEALACGTPVIAYRRSAVPEVLEDGKTGWIVGGLEEAVQAVNRVSTISRHRCRQVFEARFSVGCMTQEYLRISVQ